MRIAIDNIIFQLQKGRHRGVSRIWANILPYLRDMLKDKHELTILLREDSEQDNYGMESFSIPKYLIGSRNADAKMLTSVCKKLKTDLFITTYQTRVNDIKSFVMVYDLIPEILGWLPRSQEAVSRKEAYLSADVLACISKNTKKDLCSWYDMSTKQVEMVYLVVAPNDFHPLPAHVDPRFTKKFGLESDYLVLDGCISEEVAETFCKAFSSLNTNFKLFSYGGALKKVVATSCEKYNIPYRAAGFLSDKEVLMALAGSKGLIFLSPYEGFGLPVLEAMACKIPVLCSDTSSLPEIGREYVHYFTDSSYMGIQNALSSFFNDENKQLVENAFARSQTFTWQKTAKKIAGILNAGK